MRGVALSHARLLPSTGTGGLMAPGPRNAFMNCEIRLTHTPDRISLRISTMQAKKATPSFHGVIGILFSVIMMFVALGQRQRGRETARRLCCTLAFWAITS